MKEGDKFARQCSHCGNGMNEGYIIGEFEYFCNEDCLFKYYPKEIYEKMNIDDYSDAYYTVWDEHDYELIVANGKLEFIN